MTDLHPDDEALSAHLDGEEPGVRDHIDGCASCTQRLDALRRVRAAVATPVPSPPDRQRDVAIARALRATADEGSEPWYRGFATKVAGIAAALLLFAGAALVLTQLADSNGKDTSTAASGSSADGAAERSAGLRPGEAAGNLGDLGELADSAALRRIVEPKVAEFALAAPSQGPAPGAATRAPAAAEDAQQQRLGASTCADVTRALDSTNVGPTYAGTATWQGTPATVLVYSVQGQPGAVHVYVTTQTDCRILEFQSYTP